ncbi:hypothetical protein DIPPA_24893 [Diplonema papillatum]|nr:hypothetical protein DIPPA_24893 [Diplonema papillatum]
MNDSRELEALLDAVQLDGKAKGSLETEGIDDVETLLLFSEADLSSRGVPHGGQLLFAARLFGLLSRSNLACYAASLLSFGVHDCPSLQATAPNSKRSTQRLHLRYIQERRPASVVN